MINVAQMWLRIAAHMLPVGFLRSGVHADYNFYKPYTDETWRNLKTYGLEWPWWNLSLHVIWSDAAMNQASFDQLGSSKSQCFWKAF